MPCSPPIKYRDDEVDGITLKETDRKYLVNLACLLVCVVKGAWRTHRSLSAGVGLFRFKRKCTGFNKMRHLNGIALKIT